MARPALSASRATAVLDLLTAFPERAFTMSEIVNATGIGFASCYNVINALVQRGFLNRRADDKSYMLGPMLVVAGQMAMASNPHAARAVRAAESLYSKIGIPVHVITVVDDELLVLASATGPAAASTSTGPGQRMPLVAPVGATFMATASDFAVNAWIARSDAGDGEHADEWRRSLTLIREHGIEIALRDPNLPDFGILLAGMANEEKLLDYPRQVKQPITGRRSLLIAPDLIISDQYYDIISMISPIFGEDKTVLFCLEIRDFPTRMTGEKITYLTQKMLSASDIRQ